MTRLDKSGGARIVARVLVAALLVTGLPGLSIGVGPAEAARMNVVVTPFENRAAVGGQELAERVTEAVKLALAASGRANIMGISPSAPAVRRALEENTLRPDDLQQPMDADKASRLGKALGADAVVFGVVKDYRYDQKAPRATIVLAATKVVVATGETAELNVTGASAEKVRYNGGEGPMLTEAIQDAAAKLAAQTVGIAFEKPKAPQKKVARKRASRWLVPLLILVAILVASNGGDHGARAAVAPPTTPVTTPLATPLENAVQLSWGVAPGVAPASFKILRAPAGNAPIGGVTSFIYSPPPSPSIGTYVELPAIILGTARAHKDTYNVELGKLYAYQIKAFISGQLTAPVDFLEAREAPSKVVGPGVPIRPRGVTVVQGPGALSASVRWTANPEPFLKGYIVYRKTPTVSTRFSKLANVPAGTTQYNDFKDISAGSQYYYIVAAVGPNAAAGPIEARSDPPFTYTQALGQLQPPQNLMAASGQDFIQLTWQASQDPAVVGYKVYRAQGDVPRPTSAPPFSAPWTLKAQVSGRATSTYKDTPLGSGQTFSYVVTSRDAATPPHESAASNQAHATTSLPPASVTLTAQPGSIPANGKSTSLLQATVKDSQAHPVAGVDVTFTADRGTLQVVAGTGGTKQDNTVVCRTDGNGVAKASLVSVTSATQVTANVAAAVTGLAPATKQVVMTVPKPKTIQVTAYPAGVPADGRSVSTITATVLDDGGEPLPSAQVTFTVDKPAIAVFQDTGGSTSGPRPTNTNGKATAVLRSAAVNAIDRVIVKARATKDSVAIEGQAEVSFTAQPSITVSVNPSQIPAAGVASTATITATVKDNTATPLENQRVGFGFDPNGAPTSPTGASVAPATAITNGAGLAFCVLTSPPNLNNGSADAIRAWIDTDADGKFDSTEISALTTISYAEPAASVAVTADPTSLPADGAAVAKISADVRTGVPNPIGPGMKPVADGTLVTFSVSRAQAGDTKSPGAFTDSGTARTTARTTNGIANAFLKVSEDLGAVRVTATAGAVSGTVELTYLPPADQILELRASPQGIPADNTSTSTITAILRTIGGQPVSGASIGFRTDLGTLSTMTGITDETGRATTTLRAGTTAGVATVTATTGTGEEQLITTVQVRFTSGEPAQIFFTVGVPNYTLPATNGLPSPSGVSPTAQVTARVVDRFGNPVLDGTNVFFKTDIGQITAAPTTQNGVAQGTLVTCDFATATNMATFAPGIASIEASAVSPQGPPRAGPLRVIFSGDVATYNWVTGGQTGTNLTTAYGASFVPWTVGGTGSEPSLSPAAGNPIVVSAILRDGNDNPLPAGVPVAWQIKYGDQTVTGTSNTSIVSGESTATFTWTPQVLDSRAPITKVLATITATPSAVIQWTIMYSVQQWIGAAGPSSSSAQRARPDSPWAAQVTGDFSGVVEFDFRDQYGNAVQNGTNIYLSARDVTNIARLEIVSNPAGTTNGTARSVILGHLSADPANPGQFLAGSFTIVARFGEIEATIGVSVNPPALP
jgi:hypothetical protein